MIVIFLKHYENKFNKIVYSNVLNSMKYCFRGTMLKERTIPVTFDPPKAGHWKVVGNWFHWSHKMEKLWIRLTKMHGRTALNNFPPIANSLSEEKFYSIDGSMLCNCSSNVTIQYLFSKIIWKLFSRLRMLVKTHAKPHKKLMLLANVFFCLYNAGKLNKWSCWQEYFD